MNIKEAEKLSGVSSRNIRFYEQKGLVKPARNTENDYREYSDEEIYRLKLIRALRMVDMPLEQIREVVTGSLPLTQAVADHRAQLLQRREQLETAISFCDSFAEQMDIDALLQQMDDADCKQMLFHRWCRDYLENLRRNTTLVFFGLFPVGTGFMLHMFAVMLWYYVPAAAYILSGVYLLCWGYVGYWLAKRWGTPLKNVLPTHGVMLAAAFVILAWESFRGYVPWVLYSVAQNLISYPVQVMLMPVLGYEMGNFGQALILVPQQFTFVLQVLLLAIIFTIGGLLGRLKNLENKM